MNATDAPFIVVGVDGSARSVEALEWAVRHAKLLGAEVHALGAWDVPATIYITPSYTEVNYSRQAAEAFDKAVTRAVDELGEDGAGVVVRKSLVQGRAARVLHDAAVGAVSLVIGSHGLDRSFPGMHLGSTASYCVHHAPCPVVVIRDEHS